MDPDGIREIILEITENSLQAQLRAIHRLQGKVSRDEPKSKRISQIDMVYDILNRAGQELHITDILKGVEQVYGVRLGRESVVSALVKKVHQGQRFVRTGGNTFSVRREGE